jgi:hypothetical protein
MKMSGWIACALALGLAQATAAGELQGVSLPDRITVDGKELVLNGMGLRKAYAVAKVYVAGLYLERKTASADEALASPAARRIVLHFVRNVSRDQIVGAWNEGFEKNAGASLPAIRTRIETLDGLMSDLATGDVLAFTAIPGKGVVVDLRGRTMGTIEGDDFARALLSIWLGPSPPNAALKAGLLGG